MGRACLDHLIPILILPIACYNGSVPQGARCRVFYVCVMGIRLCRKASQTQLRRIRILLQVVGVPLTMVRRLPVQSGAYTGSHWVLSEIDGGRP